MSEIRDAALDAIADLAEDLGAFLTDGAKKFELTPLRCSLLYELHIKGPQRQKTLGELLGVGPQQAGVLVDALTDRGFVERTPDPGDRRAVIVVLTERGVETAERITVMRSKVADRLLGHLADDELAVLRDLIRRVDDRARELRRDDQA